MNVVYSRFLCWCM